MTEVTPVLAYRMTEYGRRPIFVVLAILLIVFGAASAFGLVISIFEMLPLSKTQSFWPLRVNSIVSSLFSVASMGCLVSAGIAYLARSKHVAILLWAYFLVTLCSALVSPALQTWSRLSMTPHDVFQTALYSIVTLPRAVVDVVFLMLLRTPAVREIIRNVTGVEDSTS